MRHLLILLLVWLPIGLHASQADTPAVDTHAQAATELLTTMNVEKQMAVGAEVMADQMIRQNPVLGPYKDVILKWAATFMTWDTFGARLVAVYEESFTEAELRELNAFYKTALGQKALTVMPGLFRQSAELGSTVAKRSTCRNSKPRFAHELRIWRKMNPKP